MSGKQPAQTIKDIAEFVRPHVLDMGIVRAKRGQYLSVQLDGTDKMVRNVIVAEGVTVEVGHWVILNRVPRSNKWIVVAAVEDVARGSKSKPDNLPQPTGVTATAKPYMVILSWEGSYKDVACYEIQHNNAASATGATEAKVAGSHYWYWCAPGTQRYFRVRAVSSNFARSSWSAWVNATATAGTAYQLLGVNAGATGPEWQSIDWDLHGGAAAADMVHSHGSAAEGGDEIIPNRVGLGTSVADQDGTLAMAEATAPTNAANEGRLYVKDDGGDTELFYMDDDGNEVQITQDGSTAGGNTLDGAYDEGGAGAGRTITADSGAVQIDGAGGLGTQGNIVLDDGAGDSPEIQFVGGSNDDTVRVFLDDDAVAGDSSLIVELAGDYFSSSKVVFRTTDPITLLTIHAGGEINVPSATGYFSGKLFLKGAADGLSLDADNDTSISAPTDDKIDFEAGGSDIAYINAVGLGVGGVPASAHLHVEDATVSTTAAYTGIYAAHTKTAGASDHDDTFYGANISATLNQNGGEISTLAAVLGDAIVTDGSVGDGVNTRSVYGGRFSATVNGGTVTSHLAGFYCPAAVSGGTVSGNVYGFYSYPNLTGGTVTGNAYGGIVIVDDQIGAATVYDLYLYEVTGVNYGIYQNGTADNAFGGNILPTGNKAKNLGAAGNRWNTLYQGTSTAAGTSRLISTEKQCPVCGELMVRGTGSLCVLGEDRDFVLAHCLHCGNVAMEEHQHLPARALSERQPPPRIEFVGVEVFEMSGNSRSIRMDFRYTDDEMETFTDPDGKEREMVKRPGITNSTYLSDAELDAFLVMPDSERKEFLLQLGQREWDALEDVRLMKKQCAVLQSDLHDVVASLIGRDLATYQSN